MVKKKLNLILTYLIIFYNLFISNIVFANPHADQWEDSEKSYKDLILEGFEVKAYDMDSINTNNGFTILMFVTVLQKNEIVYECQEYQTIDNNMDTLDLSFVCRELVQPYEHGIGT